MLNRLSLEVGVHVRVISCMQGTGQPYVHYTCMNVAIPIIASLQYGHFHKAITVETDPPADQGGCPELDCHCCAEGL